MTFLLLIAGGLVTSTDSGLAVPDWPLSYGTWCPPMVGGILYEHGHRVIAGVVGLLILGLAGVVGRTEPRRWVRRLGYAALGAVALQALLGGLTVRLLLPPQVSIAHACLGQVVFCLVVSLAYVTSASWHARSVIGHGQVWGSGYPVIESSVRTSWCARAGLTLAGLAFLQLILGAVIRHTGSGVVPHLFGAALLVGVAGWTAVRAFLVRDAAPLISAHARRLLILVVGQLLLGLLVLSHRGHVALRTGHVAVGALILAQAVVLAWEASRSSGAGASGRWRDYLELTKPRLSGLVLMTTAVGYWVGRRAGGPLDVAAPLCAGTALVVGGANALNEWIERWPDALMRRTQHRPLPDGRVSSRAACRFGMALSVAGLITLALGVNMLSATLAAVSWASYVLVYTPLKRRTVCCTLVGAIPGALPPLIGWAGARGALDPHAWVLFILLFIWQLPHFLSLAVLYREDYARAGFRLLPLSESDGLMTARQTALYGMTLLPISLAPTIVGVAGTAYFYGALLLGVAFVALAARAAWCRSLQSARQLFRASVLYLPMLLVLLACDHVAL